MKKILLTTLGLATGLGAFAQLPVSTTPENKNTILEEFTGIHCTYCPDGHKRADQMMAANPGDVFVINIHTGSYANPNAGEPDFRTSFGTAIAGQSGLTGYPAGTINRHLFSGMQQGSGTAMSRGDWSTASGQNISQSSYVNVACEGTLDVNTRLLTVDVEAYFTGVGAPGSMNINVAVTQNGLEGPQTGGASFYPAMIQPNGNYQHNKMLRHLMTGQWGDVITTTSMGTLVQKQYTWTLPADINGVPLELGELKIIAFIVEGQQEIITGDDGPITYTGLNFSNNARLKTVTSYDVVCGSTVTPTVNIQNFGSATMTAATISYDVNGGTPQIFNWTGSLASLAQEEVVLNAISFTDIGNNTINVTITDVNSGPDGDMADNSGTKTNVTNTNSTATGTAYNLIVLQDRYGSEITWDLIDDATGNPVPGGTGGPYADLGSNGTLANNHSITLSNTGCYTFNIYDAYGDGINAGYGAGNVTFENTGGTQVFFNNGQYGGDDREPFELTSITGVDEVITENSISIYPNPTNDVATISFNLTESTSVTMEVYNTMGSLVFSNGTKTMNSGSQKIVFDGTELPNGIYFVNLTVGDNLITKKVSLLK
ncbi:MAG: Omp28-related outer membrane protein [Flavobacteriales bacterium]|nr:Omp28-related outer membrane protein [Flavobacteriales bacterium]